MICGQPRGRRMMVEEYQYNIDGGRMPDRIVHSGLPWQLGSGKARRRIEQARTLGLGGGREWARVELGRVGPEEEQRQSGAAAGNGKIPADTAAALKDETRQRLEQEKELVAQKAELDTREAVLDTRDLRLSEAESRSPAPRSSDLNPARPQPYLINSWKIRRDFFLGGLFGGMVWRYGRWERRLCGVDEHWGVCGCVEGVDEARCGCWMGYWREEVKGEMIYE
ncbi:hypothetical protein B0H34DRAFT_679409 [Crassisporium funariophilum]|nr:hypothetical protein B0H34DRAFT_679409 [Crassisporium funariophilum]